jgi:hypothetical protein
VRSLCGNRHITIGDLVHKDGNQLRGVDFGLHPISGGSDAVLPAVRSSDMAPKPPRLSSRPGGAAALLG